MLLREGQVLGPYRVLALAGSGGMGEVWRARDDRLQRDVALKVLHTDVGDEAARRRLIAEARAVSALQHPHIVVVHDLLSTDGGDVLVMEYVAGELVSQRLPAGGMKLGEALKISVAVADAIAAAHRAGVVHRDLKPANVLIGPSGVPKVLDFGLARRRVVAGPSDVTLDDGPGSVAGLVSGTPAYMSPEQAEGGVVDDRTDVFSFGVLVYELLTGRRVFERSSVPETLTAVLREDPELPSDWPPALAAIVRRCLRKDPERRFQSMADVRIELQEVLEAKDGGLATAASTPKPRPWRVAAVAVLAGAAVFALTSWWFLERADSEVPWKVLPLTALPGLEQQPVLSPAGDHVAFSWDGGHLKNLDIYVQQVSGGTPPLRVTSDPAADASPCWSPDGGQLAFLRARGERSDLMTVSALGGSERRVAQVLVRHPGLLPPSKIDWSPDGQFIALGTETLSLVRVATGEVIQFKPAPVPGTDRDPAFAPDGRAIAYSRGASAVYRQLWVQRLDTAGQPAGPPELLAPEVRTFVGVTWLDSRSVIAAAGWVGSVVGLYRITGDHRLRPLPVESLAAWYPSYAPAHRRMVYQRRIIDTDVVHIGLSDQPAMDAQALIASTFEDREAKDSPDGTQIAFISTRSGEPAVWRADSDGTNQILIGVVGAGNPGSPRWTPDGQFVVFDASSNESGADVYIVRAEGGTPRRITSQKGHEQVPSVSRDGQWVYYASEGAVWKVPLAGVGAPVRVTQGFGPLESVDGRWLYFNRNTGVWRVPAAGGTEELFRANVGINTWALSAEELYVIRDRSGQAHQLVASNLQTRQDRVVLELPSSLILYGAIWLDVRADGRSALISSLARDQSDLVVVDGVR